MKKTRNNLYQRRWPESSTDLRCFHCFSLYLAQAILWMLAWIVYRSCSCMLGVCMMLIYWLCTISSWCQLIKLETLFLEVYDSLNYEFVETNMYNLLIMYNPSPTFYLYDIPCHHAIWAGQNLSDPEVCYFRTVTVMAAICRGFGHWLPCHHVANFLNHPILGRCQTINGLMTLQKHAFMD